MSNYPDGVRTSDVNRAHCGPDLTPGRYVLIFKARSGEVYVCAECAEDDWPQEDLTPLFGSSEISEHEEWHLEGEIEAAREAHDEAEEDR